MQIRFSSGDPASIVSNLRGILANRTLGQMVKLELDGNELTIVIDKMGRSELCFEFKAGKAGGDWHLTEEKIALSHRMFKKDVLAKLDEIIRQAGGTMA